MQSQLFAASRLQGEHCTRRSAILGNKIDKMQRNILRPALAHRLSVPKQQKSMPVTAQAMGKADPPDVPKSRSQPQGGREWLQSILSRFGPIREKASNTTVLDFEKPLVELDNRIKEVSSLALSFLTCAYVQGTFGARTLANWRSCHLPCRCWQQSIFCQGLCSLPLLSFFLSLLFR